MPAHDGAPVAGPADRKLVLDEVSRSMTCHLRPRLPLAPVLRLRVERERPVEQDCEANMAVAGQTGIGRQSCDILLVERINNPAFKLFFDVDQVKGYIKHTGDAPGVIDRFE